MMKRPSLLFIAICLLLSLSAAVALSMRRTVGEPSLLHNITVPADYRDWRLITVAREEGSLDDLRAVLGNDVAIRAFRDGIRPFPDGTVIARLAWAHEPLADSEKAFGQPQSFVAGAPKNGVQFMVKDSSRYAKSDGWGFAQFDDGVPAPKSVEDRCLPCHQIAADRDLVFSGYAR